MPNTETDTLSAGVPKILARLNMLREIRLARMQEVFSNQQNDFLELLPLLFHTNQPGLPGYISRDCPSDIQGYIPPIKAIQLARSLCPDIDVDWAVKSKLRLSAVYLVGCGGSIDQSPDRCLDVWVCHGDDLGADGLRQLSEKSRQIEAFAESNGVFINVCMVSGTQLREPVSPSDDQGDIVTPAQFFMRERFYRSAVLLAGIYPIWWLVPSMAERHYSGYVSMLFAGGHVNRSDWLDFGGLDKLSPAEFFEHCCDTIDAAIDTPPGKLMPAMISAGYAREWPEPAWLCLEVKDAIHRKKSLDSIDLDPAYLELHRANQGVDADFARSCFYRSCHLGLSRPEVTDWRHAKLAKLAEKWGWSKADIEHLDNPGSWTIEDVREERRNTAAALQHALKQVSDQADGLSDASADCLELLGRKLSSMYARKPGFVELLNPDGKYRLCRDEVYVNCTDGQWAARTLPGLSTHSVLLETADSLVEMLVSLYVNGMASDDTSINLPAVMRSSMEIEHKRIFAALSQELNPEIGLGVPKSRDTFIHAATARAEIVFINVGFDPLIRLSAAGLHRATERPDPLSFSGTHQNLVATLDYLQVDSWGELSVVRYEQQNGGLLGLLCAHLNQNVSGDDRAPTPLMAYCFTSPRAEEISKRVSGLANGMCRFFQRHEGHGRYVLRIEDCFYLVEPGDEGFHWLEVGTKDELLQYLRDPQTRHHPVMIDPVTLSISGQAEAVSSDQSA